MRTHGSDAAAPGAGEKLMEIYRRLYEHYGPQHWWPGDSRLEIVLGAVLTQFTAWGNVEKAMDNLKAAGVLSTHALRDIPEDELAVLLRPSGTFRTKARKVKALVGHLWQRYGGDLDRFLSRDTEVLREELLAIHGIGEETADDILLYAAEKPSFVVDAYTRRILGHLDLAPDQETYAAYQELFHRALPKDVPLYNEYHALLDRHAKDTCRKRPLCAGCCLLDICATGLRSPGLVDMPAGRNL